MHNSSRNGVKTAFLLGLMSAFILLIGSRFGSGGLTIALVFALGINGFTYFYSDKLALRSMNARPVSEAEAPQLYRLVAELAAANRMPMPRLYVSPATQPNAFATGRSPRHAAVCCTEGILAVLDERELRGVLGHEIAHVANRDILLSSIAAGLATVIMFVARMAWFAQIFGGRDDDEEGGGLEGLALIILGPIAAMMMQLALSRAREFQADASGARVTGDPLALASALRKLEAGTSSRPLPATPDLATTSQLMIANPFGGRRSGLGKLFATHPPMEERIRRLEAMTGGPSY